MTLARWLMAGCWLLLFWLVAATVWAPAVQRELASAAQSVLSSSMEADGYPPIEVTIDGQCAILRGKVRQAEARLEAERLVRNDVRTQTWWTAGLDRYFNPVTQVVNEIEVAPFPAGWLLLAAQGKQAKLTGTAATEFEARDAQARALQQWSVAGGRLDGAVKHDSSRFDEASNGEQTLREVPGPKVTGGISAQVQIAQLGGAWRPLTIDAADTELEVEVKALGVSDPEWRTEVLPVIQAVRRQRAAELARQEYEKQQALLPPPHVFMAAREKRILMIGEVATLGIKRELLNSVIATFPDWRIIDDIRVTARRRAVADFGPITTALVPEYRNGAKSLVLGLSGKGWETVDWQVGREARPWADVLPEDLPPDLLARDSIVATEWLQGETKGIPAMPLRAQPSFLTLTLLPERVVLAGQLAEEAFRSQLIDAARRLYGDKAEVDAEGLLARGTCEPSTDVEQTVRSLPPLPKADEPSVLAFAKPGEVWRTTAATAEILEAGGLADSGLLPADFPGAMAEDTFADAYDYVRARWQKRVSTTTVSPNSDSPPGSPGRKRF